MPHHLVTMPDQPIDQNQLDTSKIGGLGPRVAAFLRHRYPKNRAKLIARDLDVSPPTAERWLYGDDPPSWRIEAMYRLWGEPLIRAVFPEAFAASDRRIAELEAALAEERRRVPDRANEQVMPNMAAEPGSPAPPPPPEIGAGADVEAIAPRSPDVLYSRREGATVPRNGRLPSPPTQHVSRQEERPSPIGPLIAQLIRTVPAEPWYRRLLRAITSGN